MSFREYWYVVTYPSEVDEEVNNNHAFMLGRFGRRYYKSESLLVVVKTHLKSGSVTRDYGDVAVEYFSALWGLPYVTSVKN